MNTSATSRTRLDTRKAWRLMRSRSARAESRPATRAVRRSTTPARSAVSRSESPATSRQARSTSPSIARAQPWSSKRRGSNLKADAARGSRARLIA